LLVKKLILNILNKLNLKTNMNKLSLPFAIVAILLSLGLFLYAQKSSELVYVDVNKLLDGYKRTKVVRAEFEVKAKTLQSNLDSLVSGWQKELKDYEKNRSKFSKKELALKQELLGNKQQQINNYQQAVQKQIKEEDQKATQTVINDINDYVKEYGKKKGYKIIFGASGSGNIMYADKANDLTEKISEGLNKEFETN
jgi:outer membrane protein